MSLKESVLEALRNKDLNTRELRKQLPELPKGKEGSNKLSFALRTLCDEEKVFDVGDGRTKIWSLEKETSAENRYLLVVDNTFFDECGVYILDISQNVEAGQKIISLLDICETEIESSWGKDDPPERVSIGIAFRDFLGLSTPEWSARSSEIHRDIVLSCMTAVKLKKLRKETLHVKGTFILSFS